MGLFVLWSRVIVDLERGRVHVPYSRLAFGLLAEGLVADDLDLAIDGAQVKTGDTVHFPITEFLHTVGWDQENPSDDWRGVYANPDVVFPLSLRLQIGAQMAPANRAT